jgi:uncharacterized heparinase superfamily protein
MQAPHLPAPIHQAAARVGTLYHTLKYLKFSQVGHRVLKRVYSPQARSLNAKRRPAEGVWHTQELYQQKFLDQHNVRFLNHPGKVTSPRDWNEASSSKLWLYNLHYFDDLAAFGSQERRSLQYDWVCRWIDENPASAGNGWEPYPTSLRLVNWVKAFLSGLPCEPRVADSVAAQADLLSRNLEKHLLGNHLFVNAKALIFAGSFLEGKAPDKWLATGLSLFERELEEQVLSDGGNFELSPMYHAIMLVDLLDLINLSAAYPERFPTTLTKKTKETATRMVHWLEVMSHRDKRISFFNDSTFGVAPERLEILEYAHRLKLGVPKERRPSCPPTLYNLPASGYVAVHSDDISLLADLAAIGPDYIPGHAHADALSFELSLGEKRVFVNSGISEYGISDERLRQRETLAHNTVSVNGANSSEVWSGFRVARRATILERSVTQNEDGQISFSASHNGFAKQGIPCIHSRTWHLNGNLLKITDTLDGKFSNARGALHLHPDTRCVSVDATHAIIAAGEYQLQLEVTGAALHIEDTSYHPEFGVSLPTQKLVFTFRQPCVTSLISWIKGPH